MEPTSEQHSQPPLTLDMIKPTPDNEIPPNGIFPHKDHAAGFLFRNFKNEPQNPEARLMYLKYIATIGDKASALIYLSTINLPEYPELSEELKLKEIQLLADLFMNAAEAAKRRNKYHVQRGASEEIAKIMGGDPLEDLKLSLQYQQEAEKLRKELEKKQSK